MLDEKEAIRRLIFCTLDGGSYLRAHDLEGRVVEDMHAHRVAAVKKVIKDMLALGQLETEDDHLYVPNPTKLEQMLDLCRDYEMSEEEKEEQRISFAYGNAKIHNPEVTREMVVEAARQWKAKRGL